MKVTTLNEDWVFRKADDPAWKDWLPAQVPGHVHLDLVENSIIQHPYFGMSELGCQWVDEADWEYRTNFELGPLTTERRVLRLGGLDTLATVMIDGVEVGRFKNMFIPVEIDLAGCTEGEHELVVRFQAALPEARRRRAAYFAQEGLKEETGCFYPRVFMRKAQYMFGWDWGPELVSCGIWQPVEILEFDARITDVHVRQMHGEKVSLLVESTAEGEGKLIHHLVNPDGVALDSSDGKLAIPDPQLWWPVNCGDQPLYTLVTELRRGDQVLDSKIQRIGLRTVELLRQPDEHGESFEFAVNGRRIWCFGANWIPDSSFPATVDSEQVADKIALAAGLNMNMLRVWGGGTFESEAFYDACDEHGILVWQDFPYGCAYHPDTGEWFDHAVEEAAHHVARLRNRASLAIWCGNNENHTMHDGGWAGKDKMPSRYYGERIYDEALPGVLKDLDPDRPYVPSSPWSPAGLSNDGGVGDQHYWDVWHGRGDWRFYADSTARFSSEFGFASAPSLHVWEEWLPSTDVAPDDAQVRWHDKTLKPWDTFRQMVELHYPASETLEEWTYFSRLNQRDAMRFALEHYRCSSFCRGALIWQFNDCWPVQSWSLVDCAGIVKPAGHECARLFSPVLFAIRDFEDRIEIWGVNDDAEEWYGPVSLALHETQDGNLLHYWEPKEVALPPGTRDCLLTLNRKDLGEGSLFLRLMVDDEPWAEKLLQEPRETVMQRGQVEITPIEDGIRIRAITPVFDLVMDCPDTDAQLMSEPLNLLPDEEAEVAVIGDLSYLIGRCLSGSCDLMGAGQE